MRNQGLELVRVTLPAKVALPETPMVPLTSNPYEGLESFIPT